MPSKKIEKTLSEKWKERLIILQKDLHTKGYHWRECFDWTADIRIGDFDAIKRMRDHYQLDTPSVSPNPNES